MGCQGEAKVVSSEKPSGVRKRVVFADVPWTPEKPERGYKTGTTVRKTGTRAYSPKPPFYKRTFLFPQKNFDSLKVPFTKPHLQTFEPLCSLLEDCNVPSHIASALASGHRARAHLKQPTVSYVQETVKSLHRGEGRKVTTKNLFEQEPPKIGTRKCSTKRGVREPLHVENLP